MLPTRLNISDFEVRCIPRIVPLFISAASCRTRCANLPVKIRKESVEIQVVALECNSVLVDGQLVLRHIDDTWAESLRVLVSLAYIIRSREPE